MSNPESNKFKVGDKIRRTYVGYYDMPIGSEWIVEEVVNNKEIKLKGSDEVEWLSENFELVSSNMQDIKCKFKVGDKVKVVSHKNTVKRFNGDSDGLAKIGTVGIVNNVTGECVGIEGDMWLLDMDDVILLDKTESANKETNTSQNKLIDPLLKSDVLLPKNDEDDFTCCLGKGIESDGGSSSYYFTKLPKHLIDQIVETGGIEIKDIIRYVFDNNADAFNIIKAQKRIIEHSKGKGKAGITGLYDAKKITFFANEQYEAMKNKES